MTIQTTIDRYTLDDLMLSIDVAVSFDDDDDGYRITAKISDTERGREVLTLLRDRVLSKMSVGFEPIEHEERDGVTVRTKVRLREVSIVPFPAYDGATVEQVRNETETETETENGEIMSENETRDSGELVEVDETRVVGVGDVKGDLQALLDLGGAQFLLLRG